MELDPRDSETLIQMGTFSAMQGNLRKAEKHYDAALRAPRGLAEPEKSMALGKIRGQQGQPRQVSSIMKRS